MRGLGRLTASLARNRRHWDSLFDTLQERGDGEAPPAPGRLTEVIGFGSNPGALRMLSYVPASAAAAPPLVVVLHGCTQSAAAYDRGAGWSTLADRYGFALLVPEQQRTNNPKVCFNWFQPGHTERGRGEALSIRQMVDRMVGDHGIDRSRIFVTGLSAGGAMASVMLATYPDVFAGGAIVAGLPYGAARNVQEAFESMFNGRTRPAREWGDLVRAASPHRGPWPKVSIWHGSADATVVPMNAGELVKQWTNVHGLPPTPSAVDKVDGYPRRVWRGADGEALVEEVTVTGMAHGTPLAISGVEEPHGAAGPFLLDVGIPSSLHIAKFWGIAETAASRPAGVQAASPRPDTSRDAPGPRRDEAGGSDGTGPGPEGFKPWAEPPRPDGGFDRSRTGALAGNIQAVITKALRSAGLLGR